MLSKNVASMTIWKSMGQEIRLILGQVSFSLVNWKRNLQTDKSGPGRDWRENSWHPGQIIYGQSYGSQWERTPSWRKSKNGLKKRFILTMQENCVESISLTRRTRSSKKSLGMQEEIWKRQWLLFCLARQARRVRKVRPVAKPMSSNQNLRITWKPVNPQDCIWKNLYRIIMSTTLQEKGGNSLQHYNLVHKFIPVPQAMKIPAAKAAVEK